MPPPRFTTSPRRLQLRYIVEGDIEAYFDRIDHASLMSRVRKWIGDRNVLAFVKAVLAAGVMTELGTTERSDVSTPQGEIISPLLANIALSALDEAGPVLGIVFAPAETEEGYRSLADLLLSRGMRADAPLVVVSDGARGMPAGFSRSFTNVRFQRCQWHLANDMRELAPTREKEAVISAAWWVLRAPNQDEADHRLDLVMERFHRRAPESLAALERGFFDATLCLRQPVVQRTNGRAERYARELRPHYRPREAFRDTHSAVRRISSGPPILNAQHTGLDWYANLLAAQLGLPSRLTAFPTPIHT